MELTTKQLEIKNELEVLFNQKIIEFNLPDWKLKWTKGLRTYGLCNYKNKTINLSLPIAVSDKAKAIDTLLHEFAHALTPKDKGHGNEWKMKCIEIGAEPIRCANPIKLESNLEQQLPKQSRIKKMKSYQLTCPCCTFTITKYRKVKSSYSCPKCSPTYDERYKLIWTEKEYFRMYSA